MAKPGGGGAEAHARSRKYDYGDNSNLVLGSGSRPRGDADEHTGEPETLRGRIDPRSFGDRAVQAKPPGEPRRRKARDAADHDIHRSDAKRRRRADAVTAQREVSVLSLIDDVVYRPRTKDTRAAYEALLSVIQRKLGCQPPDVLGSAADEVLAILNNDKIKSPEKEEIEKFLDPISNQMFNQLVSIGKLITDIHDTAACDSASALDENIGVAVEFEENEDDEGSDSDQVQDDLDEDGGNDMLELNVPGAMQIGDELDDDDMHNSNEGLTINAQDIDAYWLQRKVSQAYEDIDAQGSQELAFEIMSFLSENDDKDVENRLVMLLGYDNFDLIKLLLRNCNTLKIF